ncbi:hypothetical protein ACGGAQ_19265 [Micromonospora sp. NPDC047557]|uniref:hypothetical protein n=1 Tax=Micromonospora sp. NPDC047557 TaxID=3364250 RepID=UPI0037243940
MTPLQQDVSCLSVSDVLIVSPGGRNATGEIKAVTLAGGPILITDHGLQLDIGLQYDVIRTEDPDLGPYKVRTRAYDYALRDADDRTLVSYHWHPLGRSTYEAPHFHIPPTWPRIHFPCERTSLESIIRLCIQEIGAEAARDDWNEVLSLNEGKFKLYRSWNAEPELAKARAS